VIQWKLRIKGQPSMFITDEMFQNLNQTEDGNPDIGPKANEYMVNIPGQGGVLSTQILGYSYERIERPLSDFAKEQLTQLNHDGLYRLMLLYALHNEPKYRSLSEDDKMAADLLKAELSEGTVSDTEKAYRRAFRKEWFDFDFEDEETREAYFAEWRLYATGEKEARGYSRERIIDDVAPKTLYDQAQEVFAP
jgi:hypothetical protein